MFTALMSSKGELNRTISSLYGHYAQWAITTQSRLERTNVHVGWNDVLHLMYCDRFCMDAQPAHWSTGCLLHCASVQTQYRMYMYMYMYTHVCNYSNFPSLEVTSYLKCPMLASFLHFPHFETSTNVHVHVVCLFKCFLPHLMSFPGSALTWPCYLQSPINTHF